MMNLRYCVEGHKTTLSFNDLLGVFLGLRKTIVLTIILYYKKRIQFKISKGKRCLRQSLGETRCQLPVILSQWSYRDSTYFSQQQCVTTYTEYCRPGKLT